MMSAPNTASSFWTTPTGPFWASLRHRGSRSQREIAPSRMCPTVSWCTKAVTWCAESGIAQGDGAGHFVPGALVTRQTTLAMLYRCLGVPEADETALTEVSGSAGPWQIGQTRRLLDRGKRPSGRQCAAASGRSHPERRRGATGSPDRRVKQWTVGINVPRPIFSFPCNAFLPDRI